MTWEVRTGDVISELRKLEPKSIQCVVTSPPYWGLRDYGVAGMIGLEPTLAGHIATLTDVFAEVARVLRDDGTVWLNYGDAYAGSPARVGFGDQQKQGAYWKDGKGCDPTNGKRLPVKRGLPAKQRYLMPARVALALQDDGWWIRSEIIWAKGVSFCPTYSGSVMPSSVRDRPTDAHETIYLLSKCPRYFYDPDAVREQAEYGRRDWQGEDQHGTYQGKDNSKRPEQVGYTKGGDPSTGRNLRTVWTINPRGYREAHFATFPEALVVPCLKAGTSEVGACAACGAPWRRVVEASGGSIGEAWHEHADDPTTGNAKTASSKSYRRNHLGWEATCDHPDAERTPCVVLDPFNGSGTTGAVAVKLGLDYIGIELNPEYAELARKRIGRAAASIGEGGDVTWDVDPVRAQMGLFTAGVPSKPLACLTGAACPGCERCDP